MEKSEIIALAEKIRSSETWEDEDLKVLCEAADMLDAYNAADGETFEQVVYAAAEKLGVEII